MNILLFLAADYADEGKSGKLNIHGIFNNIHASQFPTKHPMMYLVIKIAAELGEYDTDHDLKILFLDEDGEELAVITGTLRFGHPSKFGRAEAQLIIQVGNMPFPKPGRYEFRLVMNTHVLSVIPLDVIDTSQPDDQTEQ